MLPLTCENVGVNATIFTEDMKMNGVTFSMIIYAQFITAFQNKQQMPHRN